MFQSARIKLTAWYLAIIMSVSLLFSVAIYAGITRELKGIERFQQLRLEQGRKGLDSAFRQFIRDQKMRRISPPNTPRILAPPNPEMIQQARMRLAGLLGLVNLVILFTSGIAGYFLAGKTLRPIKEMVDEQNRFVSDASHELRTPITSLRSEIEVNLRDRKLTLNEAKKLLKSNLEEVRTLQALSDGLIKLSRDPKSNGELSFKEVSLTEIVDGAVKKVAGLAKEKRITIQNEIKNFIFDGDQKALTELFVIFLDNAIKYSPESTTAILASRRTDGYVHIDIVDQGIGIDEKDIPRLFDRFYRVDPSRTKTDVTGYGLGLSIAKQIVDKHQGWIKVTSELNKGTTISVQLPVKQKR